MTAKIFLTVSFLTSLTCSYCQTNKVDVFIEKLSMHWQFRKAGDTLHLSDYALSADTFEIKVFLRDVYGSYQLIMTDKKTNETQNFCYKGDNKKFRIDTINVYNVDGTLSRQEKRVLYFPISTSCNQ